MTSKHTWPFTSRRVASPTCGNKQQVQLQCVEIWNMKWLLLQIRRGKIRRNSIQNARKSWVKLVCKRENIPEQSKIDCVRNWEKKSFKGKGRKNTFVKCRTDGQVRTTTSWVSRKTTWSHCMWLRMDVSEWVLAFKLVLKVRRERSWIEILIAIKAVGKEAVLIELVRSDWL